MSLVRVTVNSNNYSQTLNTTLPLILNYKHTCSAGVTGDNLVMGPSTVYLFVDRGSNRLLVPIDNTTAVFLSSRVLRMTKQESLTRRRNWETISFLWERRALSLTELRELLQKKWLGCQWVAVVQWSEKCCLEQTKKKSSLTLKQLPCALNDKVTQEETWVLFFRAQLEAHKGQKWTLFKPFSRIYFNINLTSTRNFNQLVSTPTHHYSPKIC